MPYEIQMDNKECEGHAVVKLDDGFIMGCHKTHEEAEKQLQAILINEAKQKEFVVKDNLNYGEWDWDMLANEFDLMELDTYG